MQLKTSIFAIVFTATIFLTGAPELKTPSQAAESDLDHYRQLLVPEFAASVDSVSFPVVFAPNSGGLLFLDRSSGAQKIIYADSTEFRTPYLSADGKRLLFVQRKFPKEDKELISCNVSDWHCETILKTNATVAAVIELTADTYVYSSSPVTMVEGRRRTDRHNFFFLKKSAPPIQLTKFDAYQLGPMSISGGRLLFTAVHGAFDKEVIPAPTIGAVATSDIFSATLTDSGRRLVLPEIPLKPHFLIDGYSTDPSISDDAEYVAFVNRRNEPGRTHFNLAIANKSEKVVGYIKAKEFGFSRPIFVSRSIIANELLHDHYEVKEYTQLGEEPRVLFKIDFSVGSLKKLPRITLSQTTP